MGEETQGEVPYWEDPVYRHLSKLQREGVESVEDDVQSLIDGSMDSERYDSLLDEARTARKQAKQERKQKQKQKGFRRPDRDDETSINVADLKKRIFNPRVSKENMIKAIEALPPGERKSTVEGLPPGLKRKLGKYLEG